MWHNNKKVLSTFSSHHSKNAYANIQGVGWRRIKPDTPTGVNNLYAMMNAARAHNRLVNVDVDGANQITTAYLK